MAPIFLISMERFPETLYGKIDMNKLPEPDQRFMYDTKGERIAPETKKRRRSTRFGVISYC
jgi:hypothetical protein